MRRYYKNMLRELRRNKGISQSELANLMDVNQRTISTWEIGRSIPKPYQMKFLAEFYKTPIEQIFFEAFNYKNELKLSI